MLTLWEVTQPAVYLPRCLSARHQGPKGGWRDAGMLVCVVASPLVIGRRTQRLDADSRDELSVNWDIPPELSN